jgi:hypothetical protein
MTFIRKAVLLYVAWIVTSSGASILVAEDNLFYFRRDGGVAGLEADSLPERLDSPDALRWRTPIDSGHSSPAACKGRLFLTTYNTATKELATLALAADTGNELPPLPASKSSIVTRAVRHRLRPHAMTSACMCFSEAMA